MNRDQLVEILDGVWPAWREEYASLEEAAYWAGLTDELDFESEEAEEGEDMQGRRAFNDQLWNEKEAARNAPVKKIPVPVSPATSERKQ